MKRSGDSPEASALEELYRVAHQHHLAGRLAQAEQIYRRILQVAPQHPQTLNLLGVIACQTGHYKEAEQLARQAILANPKVAAFYNNLGNALKELKQNETAEQAYQQALKLKPNYAGAMANLAGMLCNKEQIDQAQDLYQKALGLDPRLLEAHLGLGNLYRSQGRMAQAQGCYQQALQLQPQSAEAYFELGLQQRQQGDIQAAIDHFKSAIRLKPDYPAAYNNLGAALQTVGFTDQAIACFQRVIKRQPDLPEAHFNLGTAWDEKSEYSRAITHYQAALAQHPANDTQVLCYMTHSRLQLADWSDYDSNLQAVIEGIKHSLTQEVSYTLPPITLNALPLPTSLRAAVARQQSAQISKRTAEMRQTCHFSQSPGQVKRLKIGYISPDFRSHAVGNLVQGLFAQHDRSEFEIYAYALVNVNDEVNQQIRAGCDVYRDLSGLSTEQAARGIYADGIHILVDLAGYTTYSRTDILALQPAPVQAQFLGYNDTMGADFIPYLIADQQALPVELSHDYSETIVYLPDSFMVLSPLPIAEGIPSRQENGLPEHGFIFCCFNAFYKIDPGVFSAWMSILTQVPGSILWLSDSSSNEAKANLRRAAEQHGTDPQRILFAGKLPQPEYLRRYQLAGLFLDTFNYNAGSTAAAALWAGTPVLCLPGKSFLTRMSSSLCWAAGLSELNCSSKEEYIERAVHLATHPGELDILRQRLASQRESLSLFDLPLFTHHLEQAFQMMWQDKLTGCSARHLVVT
jgi:protein O-GlcNAc transferase